MNNEKHRDSVLARLIGRYHRVRQHSHYTEKKSPTVITAVIIDCEEHRAKYTDIVCQSAKKKAKINTCLCRASEAAQETAHSSDELAATEFLRSMLIRNSTAIGFAG